MIESWRRHYNAVRPHASLGYRPPAPEVFVPAFAAWPAGATPTGSRRPRCRGAQADAELTFTADHSMGADQLTRSLLILLQDAVDHQQQWVSLGRSGGLLRRYPGGTENRSILATVLGSMPKIRAASRWLIPSAWQARRTRA